MNLNDCLIYEMEVLNQAMSAGELPHGKNWNVARRVDRNQDRRQVMIGLRPRWWVSEIGNWGLEGKDEGSLR